MEELIKSFKAQLHDRATSPLSGAFILSWLFCNWEIMLVAISDSYIYDKIFHLKNLIKEAGINNLLIIPFLSTLFLIFLYPYFSNIAYKASRWHQNALKKIKIKYDGESPISQDEAKKLQQEIFDTKIKYENKIQNLQTINEKLEQKNTELEQKAKEIDELTTVQIPKPQRPPDLIEDEYPEQVYKTLDFLNTITGDISKESLLSALKMKDSDEKLIYEKVLHHLIRRNKISDPSGFSMQNLKIAMEGKELLLELKKKLKAQAEIPA